MVRLRAESLTIDLCHQALAKKRDLLWSLPSSASKGESIASMGNAYRERQSSCIDSLSSVLGASGTKDLSALAFAKSKGLGHCPLLSHVLGFANANAFNYSSLLVR